MILRSILSGGICAMAGLAALSAAAEGGRPYLSWPGKVMPGAGTQPIAPRLEKALPNPATGASGFDIPQSPYGQVGSPYAQPAPQVTVSAPPVLPPPAPAPPAPPVVAEVKAEPVAQVPEIAEVAPPPAPERGEDKAFVLPPTSKYAVRQTAKKDEPAPLRVEAEEPAETAPQSRTVTATAPALSEPLIVPETESVFVPGMRVSDPATQSPRFYSLHRAYGYQPDPVENQGGDLKIDPSRVETRGQGADQEAPERHPDKKTK